MLRNCSSAFELSTAAAETGRSVVSGLALSCVCGGVTTARGATDARAALTRVARARSAAVPRCPDANDAPAFDRADDARHRADAAHATAGAAHAEDDMMREGTLTKIHARAGDESPHAVPCVRRECRGIDATGTENPCTGDRRHRDAADGVDRANERVAPRSRRRSVVYSYAKFLTDARTKFRTRALPGKRSQSKTEIAEVIFSRNKRSSSGDVNFRSRSSVEAQARTKTEKKRSVTVLSRAQVASSRLFRCVLLRARVANELDSRPARAFLSLSLSPRAPLSARPVRAPAARSRVDRRLASTQVRSIHWFPYDRVGEVNADS